MLGMILTGGAGRYRFRGLSSSFEISKMVRVMVPIICFVIEESEEFGLPPA
jgi:hypothetical protein